MNSSAFSCGEGSSVPQPLEGGLLSFVLGSPATWRSLKTARPQYCGAPPSGSGFGFTGVSNEKYIVEPLFDPDSSSAVIHGCDAVLVGPTFAL